MCAAVGVPLRNSAFYHLRLQISSAVYPLQHLHISILSLTRNLS